jgi:hypothetical protein
MIVVSAAAVVALPPPSQMFDASESKIAAPATISVGAEVSEVRQGTEMYPFVACYPGVGGGLGGGSAGLRAEDVHAMSTHWPSSASVMVESASVAERPMDIIQQYEPYVSTTYFFHRVEAKIMLVFTFVMFATSKCSRSRREGDS